MYWEIAIGLAAAWFIYSKATRKSPNVRGKQVRVNI